ncbi:general secretion pathway protein D [Thiohalospira halophila DSM 15071]|uniref:General secretion pathway protein D n=1 Tax=Thiohalospira halophila DSM 15071 TaxID=1123397 RepID=A0A1I1NKS9_9GAMM|nr:type II secretion system secretin GspD [Thiohalospira halophila]SFC94350.1 general secretion pathway protein D [Thiohalospira halophila DSM 15071]
MSQSRGRIRRSLLGLALWTLLPGGAAAEPVTLNFQEADLRAVVETVSEATGRNFVVDPRVKGQVTLVSSQPLEGEAVYEAFLSVLDVHGFTAVPDGDTTQIVPASRAKQGAIPTNGAGAGGEFVTRVVTVEHVPAAQLVPILRPLVAQEGHMAAYQPTNTLILSDRARNADRLVGIVDSLDRPDQGRSKVIELEQAAAEEVVRIVEQMEQAGQENDQGARIVADSRTNSVILRGDPADRMRMEALVHHLDTPVSTDEGNTHVIYLRYARAEEIIKVLQGLPEGETGDDNEGEARVRSPFSGVRMQADEGTNALVITAPPNRMRAIRSVINRLDIRRAQVMVEAIIAEVSADTSREFGIQWLVDGTNGGGVSPAGAVNFSTGNSGIVPLASSIAQGGGANLGDGMSAAFGQIGAAETDFAGLVRALSSDSNVNVLSTPSLVTLDNEEAEIVVGQNQPFVTGQYTSTGSGSTPNNPFQTIQREDVGLTLKVSPQINEGSAVRLAIEQEVSSVLENTDTGPVTNKREIKTNVIVDDGRILVLGGLIDEEEQVNEQRVPLLGDIPVLGWLFRYNKTSTVKRNLMIFLRPTILRDGQDAQRVSSAKYSALRQRQLDTRDSLRRLGDSDASPVMEDLDEFLELPAPYPGNRPGDDGNGADEVSTEEVPRSTGEPRARNPDIDPAPVAPPPSAARSAGRLPR